MRFFRSRLFRIFVTLTSLLIVVGLSRSLYSLWLKKDIMRQRQESLTKLEREQQELKKKLEEAQSPEFIERAARENLGLIKEGEAIVLVPNDKSTNLQMTNKEEDIPNWRKWWKLFF